MTRFLPLALLLLLVPAPTRAAAPDIVFIMADDLGWADVAFHGGNAPTPHLDRLAAEGLELTRHYVAPVCSPTRAGLLTGRFWSRFGVTTPQNHRALPWDTETLPRVLRDAGYATCLTGKWHLGSAPEEGPHRFGFDHSYGSLAGGVGPWNHFYKQGPWSVTWHRNGELITEEGHVTDLITREAVRWIGERAAGERIFLYVPFTAVHLPVKEPEEWLARVPESITGVVERHYAACVMHLDDAVGRIVDALDKSGRRRNTLLVFTSDNGGSTAQNNDTKYPADDYPEGKLPGKNRPWRGQKGDLHEGGIRVPTIVSWPDGVEPGKCEVPVHVSDWMPTFCALAGAKPAGNPKWDGIDLSGILHHGAKAEAPDRALYWAAPSFRARAASHGHWKIIVSGTGEGQKIELYDLAADPAETLNRAADDPAKVAALRARLEEIASADLDAVAKD